MHNIETNAWKGPTSDQAKRMISLWLFVQVIKFTTAIAVKHNAIKSNILLSKLLGLFTKTNNPTVRANTEAGMWE